jgi:hypothetical protein
MLQVRSDEEPLRQRRAIRIAALVTTALFMENLDSNTIVTALPQMARSSGPPIGSNIGVTRLHARSGRRYSDQRLDGGSLPCPGRVGLGERINEHARADARQTMQLRAHRRDDTEVAAAAAQRPEQLLFAIPLGDNGGSLREHNVGGLEELRENAAFLRRHGHSLALHRVQAAD